MLGRMKMTTHCMTGGVKPRCVATWGVVPLGTEFTGCYESRADCVAGLPDHERVHCLDRRHFGGAHACFADLAPSWMCADAQRFQSYEECTALYPKGMPALLKNGAAG